MCFLQVGKKSTKSEKEFRVQAVYGMLVDGKSRTDICQYCSETWEVSERTGDHYIADARQRLEKDCQITREHLLAELSLVIALFDNRQNDEVS